MNNQYRDGDILITRDGKKHRYMWWNREHTQIFVKPVGKAGKAYLIKPENVVNVEHKP